MLSPHLYRPISGATAKLHEKASYGGEVDEAPCSFWHQCYGCTQNIQHKPFGISQRRQGFNLSADRWQSVTYFQSRKVQKARGSRMSGGSIWKSNHTILPELFIVCQRWWRCGETWRINSFAKQTFISHMLSVSIKWKWKVHP